MNKQTQEALKMAIEKWKNNFVDERHLNHQETMYWLNQYKLAFVELLKACKEALESKEQDSLRWANAVIDAYKDGYEAHRVESQEQEPVAYILRNEYNEYRLEPLDNLKITDFPVEAEVKLYTHPAPKPECSNHPDAPHGFCRDASHSADRYVCECEGWEAEQPAQELVYLYMDALDSARDVCKYLDHDMVDKAKAHTTFFWSDIDKIKDFDDTRPAPSWQGLTAKEIASIPLNEYTVQTVERMLKEKNT